MSDTSNSGMGLDPEQVIIAYRDAIRERDTASTPQHRAEFEVVAKRLRRLWEYWHGTDTLHETVFGEAERTI